MKKEVQALIAQHSPYQADAPEWVRLLGGDAFDYPIDYWVAVLGTDVAKGTANFLVRWEPNAYCHFHKHLGRTTVIVLEGEHHVVEESPTETVHKTRKPGHLARNPPGDVHMEYGGPQGSTLLFCMQADDGVLFEFLTRGGEVLRTITVEDFAERRF